MAKCVNCGEEYSNKRKQLGYNTCLDCSKTVNKYTIAPAYNKGAYQVISRKDVKDIGR